MNGVLLKKRSFYTALLILLLNAIGLSKGYAYDFSAVCPSGQTLYFLITNSTNHYVAVVYPGSSNSKPWNGYTKPTGNMVIPEFVSYGGVNYQVTSIGGTHTFYNCYELTSVVIPNSVTTIGENAFFGCNGLQELTIGEGVTSIYGKAFWDCPSLTTVHFNAINCTQMKTIYNSGSTVYTQEYCSVFNSGTTGSGSSPITNLSIGNNVTRIPFYAFHNSIYLTGVLTIPDATTYIGSGAFYGSQYEELIIGEGVETIAESAFENCSALTSLHFNATNCTQMSFSTLTSLTIGENVTNIPENAFKNCTGLTGSITIPNAVTNIGNYAFYGNSNLQHLTIGEGVTTIGDYAFWNCPVLTVVHFNALNCTQMHTRSGSGTSSSPYYYFSVFNAGSTEGGSSAITTLTIGNSVTNIPEHAFRNSPHISGSLTIPNTVTTIGQYAFYGNSNLQQITIGEGVTEIGAYAFWNCPQLHIIRFNAVNCSSMTTNSQYSVFNSGTSNDGNSTITTLIVGNNVTRIPDFAFRNSPNLTSLVIPNQVNYVGQYAFFGCSSITSAVIPNSVTIIGQYAFYGNSSLQQTTIGEGVTEIGAYAFWNCPQLQTVHFNAANCNSMTTNSQYSVFNSGTSNDGNSAITTLTIGSNVTRIPDYAFRNSPNLTNLVIPNLANYVGQYAFYGCSSQTSIAIPNSVAIIGQYAFYGNSNLQEITIGEGVTEIGDKAFWSCPQLHVVHFNAVNCIYMVSNSQFSVFNSGTSSVDASAITTLTIGNNVTRIPDYAFRNSPNMTNVVIPNSVTELQDYCFYGCNGLQNLTLGEAVTNISPSAFYGCASLSDVVIPNSVTEIGSSAFYSCTSLQELTIGESLTTIGAKAFWNCPALTIVHFNAENCTQMETSQQYSVFNSGTANNGSSAITTLTIGPNVTTIPRNVFRNCSSLQELILGEEVETIGYCAFNNCSSLTNLSIPNSVISIGSYAFGGCNSLQELTIGEGVTTIGGGAFWACTSLSTVYFNATNCTEMYTLSNSSYYSVFPVTLTTITIGSNVTNIPNYAFEGAEGVVNVVIPNSVTNIGSCAFLNCNVLQEITIGEGVTTIGEKAFWNCPALSTVRFNAINCTLMETHYNNSYYPVFSSNNQGGSVTITSLILGNNVTKIPNYAFKNANSFQRLIVPTSVTHIGNYAFYGCTELVLLRVQGTALKSIGDYAFYNCSNMAYTMNLSNPLYIGEYAFYNCSAMTGSITLPVSATSVGSYTFYNCSGLTGSLTIPNSVNSIGNSAFRECSGLSGTLVMSNNVTSIGEYAFKNCNGLTGNLNLSSNISTIGNGAFYNCSGFTGEIYIPRTATSVGDYTFYNCSGLSGNLIIPKSILTIGNASFFNCNGLTSIISECSNPPTTNSTSFSNMTSTIPVYVPWGKVSNYQSASGWNVFTNYIEQFQFEQYDTENWSDVNNWYTFEPPTANDVVCLNSNCKMNINASVLYLYIVNPEHTLTIKSGKTLYTTYGIGLDNQSQLIIEGTGQVIYGNAPSYTIAASANPTGGGTVTGVGIYSLDETCTLTALANEGYSFVNWTENGNQVSENSTYTFTVTSSRTIVANFTENTVSDNIDFADANVKALCVANWDTNGDGELSYAEAAAVTDLGEVFKNNNTITSFNELQYFTGLTVIGEKAFYYCKNLLSVTFPNTITLIESQAFYDCEKLLSAELPSSIQTIAHYAFAFCYALTSVEIPAATLSVYYDAYYYCYGLEQVIVNENNLIYDSRNDCNALIETETNLLVFGCKNTIIPNTVTAIGEKAFYHCSGLTTFEIPNSVVSIGSNAFNYCSNLVSINIPNSIVSIGNYAFYDCHALTSLEIPSSVTSIGNCVVGSCDNLNQITVDDENTVYDSRENCNAIIETNSNKLIAGCNSTIIPNTVTVIGNRAFYNCEGFTSINIPNSVTKIEQYAFAFCYYLASLEIPASVMSIGNNAFYYCRVLTSITSLAQNPPTLGNNAFMNVDKSIPVYVPCGTLTAYQTAAGWNEFTNLIENLDFPITFADANVKAICVANWDTNGDGELSYAEAAAVTELGEVFKNKYNITSFDELQFFTGLTEIGANAFRYCSGLLSVAIPSSVTSIKTYAFGSSGLTAIAIPNSVTTIEQYAFYSCYGLHSVEIGSAVTSLTYRSFIYCSGIENITVAEDNVKFDSRDNCNAIIETATDKLIYGCKNTVIPYSVPSINESAFVGSGIVSVEIPSWVTAIGSDVFGNCRSLVQMTVSEDNPIYDSRDGCNAIIHTSSNKLISGCKNTTIPNTVTEISSYAFSGCSGLTDIVIPNSVTIISNSAFNNCQGLTTITIPSSVTNIKNYAFSSCTGLESLTVLALTPPTLGIGPFNNVDKSIPVYVPVGTIAAYQAASGWSEFTNYHEIATGVTQTIELTEGWNWISTYIEAEDPVELLQMLEAALGENASQISSAELFTENDGGDWWGDLDEEGVTNEQMYMILVENACTITLQGNTANTANHAITINPGWNWIGFPCDHEMTIEEALGGFDAEEGDVFANSEFFTEFDGEWFGDVETLLPGQGFMYFSNSEETKTLIIGGGKFVPLQPK